MIQNTDKGNDRYKSFLLEESETPVLPKNNKYGLHSIHYDISEVEQCENRLQTRVFEGIFYALCELFQVEDIEMETTCHVQSLFLIIKEETDFNNQVGFRSPELSRNKLKKAEPKQVAEAIIDLFKTRNTWNNKVECKTLFL